MIEKAIALLQQQKFGLAKTVCAHLLKKTPNHYQAHLISGVCELHENRPTLAIEWLTQACRLSPHPHEQAQALSNLSLAYRAANLNDQAMDTINQAIALQPQHPLYRCNRANLYEMQEAWQAMAEDASIAFNIDHQLIEAQVSYCFALRKLQHNAQALAVLERFEHFTDQDWLNEWGVLQAARSPDSLPTRLNKHAISDAHLLAMAAYACEQRAFEAAGILYQQAAVRQPHHPEIQHQLAALTGQLTAKAPASYVSELFDAAAPQFDVHMVEKLHYRVPEQLAENLAPYLSPQTNVVDLGCGTGLAGKALLQHQPTLQLIGVDLSENMLTEARTQGRYQQLICADAEAALPSLPASDLVIMTDLLIYLGALETLFSAIDRHLHHQGLIAFSTENCSNHWTLAVTGRYQHSNDYINALGAALGWRRLCEQPTSLRTEHHEPVPGTLWIFKKV